MMQKILMIWMSRAIDLGRPTPRWVGWASRVWPGLADVDRRMRGLDARLRDAAELELAAIPLASRTPTPRDDGWRGLLVAGTGLAAAATIALGLFAWPSNETATPPRVAAAPTNPTRAITDAAQPLTDLLDRVQAGTPDSLRAAGQLQDWAGFLLLELPATDFDPIRVIRERSEPDDEADAVDRVL